MKRTSILLFVFFLVTSALIGCKGERIVVESHPNNVALSENADNEQLTQDKLREEAFNFVVEFLFAFNNDDEDVLRVLMTKRFFAVFQEAKNGEPQNNTQDVGDVSDTLMLIGSINTEYLYFLKNTPTRYISMSYGDFNESGVIEFVFNLIPSNINFRTARPYDPALEATNSWTDRWNVGIVLIYDEENGFLIDGFGLTYDR